MNNWDDIRVFVVTARTGSFNKAAARLNMDASTIGRRIARLESRLKSNLVVRSPQGLLLTAAGSRLFEAGMQIENVMDLTDVTNDQTSPRGIVRISASEGFGTTIVAPALPAFLSTKPGLTIELVANAGFLSPSIREVDIGISLAAPESARLAGEPLTDTRFGLYASADYLAAHEPITKLADLPKHKFVGYINDLLYPPELAYLDEVYPNLVPNITSTSIRAQLEMIRAGAGLGVLSSFMAQTAGIGLKRVLSSQVKFQRTIWIAAHREASATARVRTVYRWLRKLVADNKKLFI